ncbi:MAG: O-antigen ligase family protein [Deltaproteobacteria bacterium]|nr:O-antigen ligase family protein [Deltaproteobacteria bacterium]
MNQLNIRRYNFNVSLMMITLIRYIIFIAFYVLCLRTIAVTLQRAPDPGKVYLLAALFTVLGAVAWRHTSGYLYWLVALVPAISGFLLIGGLRDLDVLQNLFAVLYLFWLPRRVLFERRSLTSGTQIEDLIDLLSGIVLLSLFISFWNYPLDYLWPEFWYEPMIGSTQILRTLMDAYTLLLGLFLSRLLFLEADSRITDFSKGVFLIHFLIIIIFSLVQLIFDVPGAEAWELRLSRYNIISPFEDKNSSASYLSFLIFVFLAGSFRTTSFRRWINRGAVFILILLIILALSRAAWLALLITGAVYCGYYFPKRLTVLILSLGLAGAILINLHGAGANRGPGSLKSLFTSALYVTGYTSDGNLRYRFPLWISALRMTYAAPLVGCGIGTFSENSPWFQDRPATTSYANISEYPAFRQNAHNYFLQLSAELGLPGLAVFLAIIWYALRSKSPTQEPDQESKFYRLGLKCGLAAYVLTFITGHPLLLDNQQVLFWFIIATLAIPEGSIRKVENSGRVSQPALIVVIILSVGFALGYGYRFSHPVIPHEFGLYSWEKHPNGSYTRWTMKKSDFTFVPKSHFWGFTVSSNQLNSNGPAGLALNILLNGQLRDSVHLFNGESKFFLYYTPYLDRRIKISTEVSETFNQKRLGLSLDNRDLGVSLSPITFFPLTINGSAGFYGWETWAEPTRKEYHDKLANYLNFRWSGKRAMMAISPAQHRSGISLSMMVAHPDLNERPVVVSMKTEKKPLIDLTFHDNCWKDITISPADLDRAEILMVDVDRTWNPSISYGGKDTRDLGVAVAQEETVGAKQKIIFQVNENNVMGATRRADGSLIIDKGTLFAKNIAFTKGLYHISLEAGLNPAKSADMLLKVQLGDAVSQFSVKSDFTVTTIPIYVMQAADLPLILYSADSEAKPGEAAGRYVVIKSLTISKEL